MAFDFDTTDLQDNEDVQLDDASSYQDQTGPAPLAPGNYRLTVVEAGIAKDSEGTPILDNGYPVVVINKATIVEPEEFAKRDVYPFQKYSTRPVQGGNRKGSIPAVDLLRGFDDQLTFKGTNELVHLLAEQFSNGRAFNVSTNWTAKDSDAIKEFIEENGGDLDSVDQDEKRAFFKSAIFRGQKKFPKVNGVYVPEVVGPSGATLEARVSLTRVYPSSKTVKKMGPFGKSGK